MPSSATRSAFRLVDGGRDWPVPKPRPARVPVAAQAQIHRHVQHLQVLALLAPHKAQAIVDMTARLARRAPLPRREPA